jgi:hypothetical protein
MTAWTLVAVGAASTSAVGGNLTITLPAGGQKGDLYVAVIAYRSTPAFTGPAGWTIHQQQSLGNTSTTTNTSIGSGLIASIVRGDAAPGNVFTRTAGDVALGRILIYRASNGRPVFMASSSSTAAANATALSTAAINVISKDTLIIAGFCGADNTTVSIFDATDPATASAATDTTTPPTAGNWYERADSNTATGADTALGIADGVKATTGSTGNIICTAGNSSRHVMVAAAFYVRKRYVLAT